MGRHLEHGVRGGVDNPFSRVQMGLAIVPDDVGAGVRQIAEHASSGGCLEIVQQVLGESLWEGRQGVRGHNARNLPMADGGVLAHGGLGESGIGTLGRIRFGKTRNPVNVSKACGDHIGNLQLVRTCTGAEGIDVHVSEFLGIRHGADAKAVQNNQKNALHRITSRKCEFCGIGKNVRPFICFPWQPPRPAPPSSWW